MGPFLLAVVRTFPWCAGIFVLLWGLLAALGDLRGLDFSGQLYAVLLAASGMTVLIGGARGLRAQHAGRVKTADAVFRADRTDVGVLTFFLGALAALGAGYLANPQGGEILGVVGGLLGFWLVSSAPFSLFLIALGLGWTGGVGLLALAVHQQPLLGLWKLLAASAGVLLAASLLRRLLAVSGPPGWPRTFLTFAMVLAAPLGVGLLAPAHDFSRRGQTPGPEETAFWILTFVGIFFAYQWLCLAQPDSEGQPAEPTQGGCGCLFMGLGVLMLCLDQAGGALRFLPLALRLGLVVVVTGACALAARVVTGRVRERYRQLRL